MTEIGTFHGFVDRGDPTGYDLTHLTMTTDAQWHDWDLSAIVPSGARAVLLRAEIRDNASGSWIEICKKGYVGEINLLLLYTQVANLNISVQAIVAVDKDRKVSYKTTNTTFTLIVLSVGGWWI